MPGTGRVEAEPIPIAIAASSGYAIMTTRGSRRLTVTDDPPRVTQAVAWSPTPGGPELGTVTLTRAGGDLSQPLTVWFEVNATLTDGGDEIPIVLGGTAVIAARETEFTTPFLAGATGGFINPTLTGVILAAPPPSPVPYRTSSSSCSLPCPHTGGGHAGETFGELDGRPAG